MLEQMKLLSARRAYEFHADDIRLTLLSTGPIQGLIKQSFQFQTAAIGTPIETFGPVLPTMPPGLAFELGIWASSEGVLVPIRFMHIDPRRIVIDVAGPSSAIDSIFQRLRDLLAQVQTPDGSPLLGEPERVLDYSDISARFSYPLDVLFLPRLRNLFARVMNIDENTPSLVLAPTLYMPTHPVDEESAGAVNSPDSRMLQLALRKGTRPAERIYFSGAPLDSEAHLAYLTELDAILTSASE